MYTNFEIIWHKRLSLIIQMHLRIANSNLTLSRMFFFVVVLFCFMFGIFFVCVCVSFTGDGFFGLLKLCLSFFLYSSYHLYVTEMFKEIRETDRARCNHFTPFTRLKTSMSTHVSKCYQLLFLFLFLFFSLIQWNFATWLFLFYFFFVISAFFQFHILILTNRINTYYSYNLKWFKKKLY